MRSSRRRFRGAGRAPTGPLSAAYDRARGTAATFPILIGAGAEIDARDPFGRNALFIGVEYGGVEAVKMLAEAGADTGRRPWGGRYEDLSPLLVAARLNLADVIEVLAPAVRNVNAGDKRTRTALHEAVAAGSVEAAEALLTAGASPHRRDSKGFTPRDLAARDGSPRMRLLLGVE